MSKYPRADKFKQFFDSLPEGDGVMIWGKKLKKEELPGKYKIILETNKNEKVAGD